LDIYLPGIKKAIEFNSNYWHHKDDVKQRDDEKIRQCKEKNISLLVIDYDKWKKDKMLYREKIKSFIQV